MGLYLSDYCPRGTRKQWDRTSIGNEDAEKALRRRFALKPEIHVADAVTWWRDDGSLAAMVADLTTGTRVVMRQSSSNVVTLEFGAPRP